MAAADTGSAHEGSHDHHGPEYLAHHFESTEQQYDAGKLGIWVFLVTEILFFSGLFCAYTLYRYHHPEIFAEASNYLDTAMGAINTIVLLFSSLTMAWAVRCAQIEHRKGLVATVLTTFFCAAIFLGIKAVEYTHKWDLGIFVRSSFDLKEVAHHGPSSYLIWVSLPFALVSAAFAVMTAISFVKGSSLWTKYHLGMCVGVLGYFIGVGAGVAYDPIKASIVGETESHAEHAEGSHDEHAAGADGEHAEESHAADEDEEESAAPEDAELKEAEADAMAADSGTTVSGDSQHPNKNVGIFFSIYYFMTGLHGVHVLGGMAALSWLYFRALRGDFHRDYFGAVDNVGLYWHLVDLIWIYLFPLLYLIGN